MEQMLGMLGPMDIAEVITWAGIVLCISQSAVLSGLNLAFFSLSKIRLEVQVKNDNRMAKAVLPVRQRANYFLATVLLGNVAVNVLLTMLADSVLAGVAAFVFSTMIITIFGEIMPQAYFARNALQMVYRLLPLIRLYQIALLPIAWPVSWILDRWLGAESIAFLRENELREFIQRHMDDSHAEIETLEGRGAINFLKLDDVAAHQIGHPVDPDSILAVPFDEGGLPVLVPERASPDDPVLRRIHASGRKWVILVDEQDGRPSHVLNAHAYLRDALFSGTLPDLSRYIHVPAMTDQAGDKLGTILVHWKLSREGAGRQSIIHHDVVLVWLEEDPRILTGADVLGMLWDGISDQPTGQHE